MLATLVWAFGSALTLIMLYQHVRLSWPGSYFGPTESAAQYFSGSGLRFAVFRFLPPYIVFVAVGIYGPDPRVTTVWVTAGVYAALSTSLSVRSSVVGEPGSVKFSGSRVVVLITILVGLALVALGATATASAVATSAPPLADVVANLVASLIAAALAVAYFVSTGNAGGTDELPEELVHAIRAIALDNGADPQLAVAIAHVENVQRPKWFRTAERVTAPLRRKGTYGLFQVASSKPLGDLESCHAAMPNLRGAFPLLLCEGCPVDWSVRHAAERHNPDARFAEMVADTYSAVPVYPLSASEAVAPDGRPLLEIITAGRFGARLALRGTYWSATESVVVDLYRPTTPAPDEVVPITIKNESGRSTWRVEFSADVARVVARSTSTLEDCFTSESVELDLRTADVRRDVTLKTAPQPAATTAEPPLPDPDTAVGC